MAMTMDLLMVFRGFQVGEDFGASGPLVLQILFDLRGQGMCGCQKCVCFEQQVKLNPKRVARTAMPQAVILQTKLAGKRVELLF